MPAKTVSDKVCLARKEELNVRITVLEKNLGARLDRLSAVIKSFNETQKKMIENQSEMKGTLKAILNGRKV